MELIPLPADDLLQEDDSLVLKQDFRDSSPWHGGSDREEERGKEIQIYGVATKSLE